MPSPHLAAHRVFFPNLDALRFFACMLVFNRHTFFHDFKPYVENNFFLKSLNNMLCNGEYGVAFFFVLSGFLITYLILDELQRSGRFDLKAFLLRRSLRIWPLYFLTTFIGFIVVPFLSKAVGSSSVVVHSNPWYFLLFLSNFDYLHILQKINPLDDYTILNITWSVSIEEQFYVCFAILVFLLPQRLLPHLMIAVVLASAFFRGFSRTDPRVVYFHTFSVVSDLAIGSLSAQLAYGALRFRERVGGLSRWAIATMYGLGFSYLTFAPMLGPMKWSAVSHRLVCSLFFAFIILEQCFADRSLVKVGRFTLLSHLGTITYGIYLLHPTVSFLMDAVRNRFANPSDSLTPELAYSSACLMVTLMVCQASFVFFERPFLTLKARLSR